MNEFHFLMETRRHYHRLMQPRSTLENVKGCRYIDDLEINIKLHRANLFGKGKDAKDFPLGIVICSYGLGS